MKEVYLNADKRIIKCQPFLHKVYRTQISLPKHVSQCSHFSRNTVCRKVSTKLARPLVICSKLSCSNLHPFIVVANPLVWLQRRGDKLQNITCTELINDLNKSTVIPAHVVPVEFGVSSSLLSSANGGIGASNVLPSDRSNRNLPLENIQKTVSSFGRFAPYLFAPKLRVELLKCLAPTLGYNLS